MVKRVSKSGNHFIAASQRRQPNDSVSQKFYLEKENFYTFSAWLQVSVGEADVVAKFKTPAGSKYVDWGFARSGCWSMLKGGLIVDNSGPAELYFEVRKRKVIFHATDAEGKPLANATVSITQKRMSFPFGNAINRGIRSNKAYQEWFTARFKVASFENEMKWDSIEQSPGQENYTAPDAMLQFAQKHDIAVRGHNLLWDDPKYEPKWVKSLSPNELSRAVEKRINSIMRRYRGQLIAWDVINENLHHSFFETHLDKNASTIFFRMARQIDQNATLFLNEYNTIEDPNDSSSTPTRYLEKIRAIRSGGYHGPLAIGVQGHFYGLNLPYTRAVIDKLASAKLPIWITELDVDQNQTSDLEQVIREVFAHPAVNGIVLWAAWQPWGCYRMCLTDNNFKNLPAGDVVDRFIEEWSHKGLTGVTNATGFFETSLFHGDYEVRISRQNMTVSNLTQHFIKLETPHTPNETHHVKLLF
ncbi:hypothetical protein RJ639_010496 [Escallonia herrerae]|uniref:GH10 domain-containing protein n=1 Tax=Escallonia herrerae TaxID=1293975 RepID=A0AA88VPZ1_9ASTE|nr:hypothetical protein RJ639_010496 [Escallonia herrerae]